MAGTSSPWLGQAHHLTASDIEAKSEASSPKLHEIIEQIELTDKVSKAEQSQMLRWIKDRFDEVQTAIKDIREITNIVESELSEFLSNDAIQFLIDLLTNSM